MDWKWQQVCKRICEVSDVVAEDIVVKVPNPVELSGSARTNAQLWFQVDFSNFNVK